MHVICPILFIFILCFSYTLLMCYTTYLQIKYNFSLCEAHSHYPPILNVNQKWFIVEREQARRQNGVTKLGLLLARESKQEKAQDKRTKSTKVQREKLPTFMYCKKKNQICGVQTKKLIQPKPNSLDQSKPSTTAKPIKLVPKTIIIQKEKTKMKKEKKKENLGLLCQQFLQVQYQLQQYVLCRIIKKMLHYASHGSLPLKLSPHINICNTRTHKTILRNQICNKTLIQEMPTRHEKLS